MFYEYAVNEYYPGTRQKACTNYFYSLPPALRFMARRIESGDGYDVELTGREQNTLYQHFILAAKGETKFR